MANLTTLRLYRAAIRACQGFSKARSLKTTELVRKQFRKNRDVSDAVTIEELQQLAKDQIDNIKEFQGIFDRGERLHYGDLKSFLPCGSDVHHTHDHFRKAK